jgi:transcriptional regulator with XRE-family HTH domain
MPPLDAGVIAANAKMARLSARMTQDELARFSGVGRSRIAKIELGISEASFVDIARLATALDVPLQAFLTGQNYPGNDLASIEVELHHLGIWDLVVSDAVVPGAFRYPEEVVVLAVGGDRPQARVIEAMPFVLSQRTWRTELIQTFAALHDPRALARLAWLGELAQILRTQSSFPFGDDVERSLSRFIRSAKAPAEPDDLGHPGSGRPPPVWKRWNVTYGGDVEAFRQRAAILAVFHRPKEEG